MEHPPSDDSFTARRASFGGLGATYDAVRPEWPAATVRWLLGSPTPEVCPELTVVDLGAGTGKGTRTIAGLGAHVIAVEPAGGMRAALEESLRGLPTEVAARIAVRAGDAESVPLEAGSTDAVTAFQAWHWFDPERAAGEAARVLRPGGWLSMAWHHRLEDEGWQRELSAIVERESNQPDDPECPPTGPEFEPAETELFDYAMRQNVEDLVRHASTWSYVAIHPGRERLLEQVRALGERVADAEGMVTIPMATRCYRLRRR
ncbi:MAG TPA: class I SAM-dependent methyltransferase [Segeticoccus sp.]|uniref:class I SAM-dependent methyltransferase n=1 Tax=Segeticoccus sp. TaxID=2706531 RepID=UPI002D7EADBD|nr:class I SAM-dependent methyltransferase [Segeticoccus sp.]HET8599045.1 class I SAM-dependent methyltransferase [Segeticoccus sp.]